MGVGRGDREGWPHLDFEICSKKGCFLGFEGKHQISPFLPPLEKIRKNPQVALTGKNPSDVHVLIHMPCNVAVFAAKTQISKF